MKKLLLLATLLLAANSSWSQYYDIQTRYYTGHMLYLRITGYDTVNNLTECTLVNVSTEYANHILIIPNLWYSGYTYVTPSFPPDIKITAIDSGALSNRTDIETLYIYCDTIGMAAFRGCTNLTEVYISSNDALIDDMSEYFDSNTFEGVKHIGRSSFRDCPNLRYVTIGSSVNQIGNYAFLNCPALDTIKMLGDVPPELIRPSSPVAQSGDTNFYAAPFPLNILNEGTFRCTRTYNRIVIPCGSYESYRDEWRFIDGNIHDQWAILRLVDSTYYCYRWSRDTILYYLYEEMLEEYTISTLMTNNLDAAGCVYFINTTGASDPIPRYFVNCRDTSVTLYAVPNAGYHFDHWSVPGHGVFYDNPTTFRFNPDYYYSDFHIWVYYEEGEAETGILTVNSANPTMGTVSGGGTYNIGATATLTATANSGYHFTQWQDGNTQNPRTVTVTGNTTYTAYFAPDGGDDGCPTITSFPWNNSFDEDLTCWKTVDADGDGYNWGYYDGVAYSESYSYFDGTRQGLTPDNWLISRQIQVPASGNYKLSWRAQGANADYFNEHYSVYLSTTGDNPSNFTTQLYSETLNTANAVSRSVSLQDYHGQTVRVAFRHHNTNDVFVLLLADVKVTSTQGIDDVEIVNNLMIYTEDGHIHVTSDGQPVDEFHVYDVVGREVYHADHVGETPALQGGVYLVKVGNLPARKVVVIR